MHDQGRRSSRAAAVAARAGEILDRDGLLRNPYLTALSAGTMSREAFRLTQEQFFFAVTFFPRPMAALVGRIEDPAARLDILHNLVEEHGEFDPRAFHHNTFQEFLSRLGSDVSSLQGTSVWPELRAFNSVLIAACVLDELEVGVGCMGIIEHAFAGISAAIGQAVVDRGWLTEDRLVHYRLHAEIDIRHSEEFYAVVEPLWSDEARRYYIVQGLELGAYAFRRLYTDLSERARGMAD
ncbi:MAG TPA: iron-containing redox enzyme family protein [Candidatus Polarisedimenticolia bacterium]|nr:iron-containing redox enzyme family protein [Candidatus Polarisedimenticolia bacterium]